MAHGHGGIEVQAGGKEAHQRQRQQLQQEDRDVAAAEAGLGHRLADLRPGGELQHQLAQVGAGLDQPGQEEDGRHHKPGHHEPDQGDDQLGPDQPMDTDRQRVHQIALILEEIAVEAGDHQYQGHQHGREHGQHENDGQENEKEAQNSVVRDVLIHHADGEIAQHAEHQQGPQHRQHDAPGGAEFLFQKFA